MRKPKIGLRILLYICMLLLAGISIVSLMMESIPYAIQITIYCMAALSMIFGVPNLILDIRYLTKNVIEPEIKGNQYTARVVNDYRLRTVLFTIPGAGINVLFAIFNGVMAIINMSAWLGTLCAYYLILSIMRISAVNKERALLMLEPIKRMKQEIRIYKRNSIFFIFLAVVMAGMVILLVESLGGKTYPGYMIYVAAMFAFYKIIMATINIIKVKKEKSPLLTIIRRIGHVDACVSILTLQTAMFASFGDKDQLIYQNLMNGMTGAVVCLLVLGMGVFGLSQVGKLQLQHLE